MEGHRKRVKIVQENTQKNELHESFDTVKVSQDIIK